MATLDELADKYARKLKKAASADESSHDLSVLLEEEETWTPTGVAKALVEIGDDIAGRTFTKSGEPLDEDDWQYIADQIAAKLGYKKPKRLRRLLEERSLDSLMAMCQQIEDLYHTLRK